MEAIGLNPIRLDAIGLDPIRLNAIRLGVPGASSGSSGRPYIDPEVLASLVAVCICDGKSNNDPDRAVIKNLVDPDNPFVISNAAYKLNSGFGKYEEDFTTLKSKTPAYVEFTPSSILVQGKVNDLWLAYTTTNPFNLMKIRIKGLPIGGRFEYRYYNGVVFSTIVMEEDGEYKLPASQQHNNGIGFRINDRNLNWTGFIVEQIPSFQGALVTDGVDDLITSSKSVQEMLGGSTEVTVVSMIHHIYGTSKSPSFNYTNYIREDVKLLRTTVRSIGESGIYGYTYKNSSAVVINNILGDKNDYSVDISGTPLSSESKFSVQGYIDNTNNLTETSQVAWYWTFIAKRVLTTDEINQVIAYYNLDKYVKPDIYYDVKRQGLTNNTPDSDWYLKDFSGNGHDMQLYNYSKTPESGINEEGGLQSDGVNDYGQLVQELGLKDYTIAVDRAYPSLKIPSVAIKSGLDNTNNTPFVFDYLPSNTENQCKVISFGNITLVSFDGNRKISYQSTYIKDGTVINKGGIVNTGDGITIGRDGIDAFYSSLALWSFLLFPYSLSEFLLERQLKRYKLGTLYLDMIEWRPIIKSNIQYKQIDYFIRRDGTYARLNPGDYFSSNEDIIIRVTPIRDWQLDVVSSIKINGKDEVINVGAYTQTNPIHIDKSPQKIDITIDEYIRYEDIVQPYPFIFPIVDANNKVYSWGDKIKVGTEIKFAYGSNLLPQLYELRGEVMFNGNTFDESSKHIIGKTNIFTLTEAPKYLKDNEPNCILAPQILRIPNASYKILGYIPDLTGKGNHGKINNSAYAGMSGVNGYKYDWSNWIKYADGKLSDNSFVMNTSATMATTKLFSPQSYAIGDKSYSFRFKISGLINNQRIEIDYPKDSDGNAITSDYLSNGEYYTKDYTIGEVQRLNFFLINANIREPVNIKIEQIGEYEGSFCLDGVEDFITIPTLSHGAKQVLMKVRSLKPVCPIYEQRTLTGVDGSWVPTFCIFMNNQAIAYADGNNGNTYIDGILNTSIQGKQLVNITHNITVTNENTKFGNTQSPLIGKLATSDTLYAQMALFSFMSFPEISSEEEIKELNDIVGIEGGYVESPDYYWDAYGKNNTQSDDIDNGIKNISNSKLSIFDKSITGLEAIEQTNNDGKVGRVYDRALQTYNFAFNEESGYGGQKLIFPFTKPPTGGWSYTEDRVSFEPLDNGNSVRITEVKSGAAFFWVGKITGTAYYKVTGVSTGKGIKFGSDASSAIWSKVVEEDGIYEIDWSLNVDSSGTILSTCILSSGFRGECDIVIEQVPQYPNGLVSDGVDDNLKNTNMPVLTDYTWIMKRKRLNDKSSTTLCHKGNGSTQNAFLFEYIEGAIKATRSFGATTPNITFPNLISYQTKNSYNGQNINVGTSEDGNALHIFMGSNTYPYYTKAVFYKAMLYSKTIDMLSINMLKNLFAKDELIDVNNPIFKKDEL